MTDEQKKQLKTDIADYESRAGHKAIELFRR
jgi:hypothetical protein